MPQMLVAKEVFRRVSKAGFGLRAQKRRRSGELAQPRARAIVADRLRQWLGVLRWPNGSMPTHSAGPDGLQPPRQANRRCPVLQRRAPRGVPECPLQTKTSFRGRQLSCVGAVYSNLSAIVSSIAENETVSTVIVHGSSVCLALCNNTAQRSAQVTRGDTREQIKCHAPMRQGPPSRYKILDPRENSSPNDASNLT